MTLPDQGLTVRRYFRVTMLRALAVLSLLLVAACAGVPRPPPLSPQQLAQVQERLYVYIGEERARLNADAKALMRDPELAAAAQAHSEAMAERGTFDSGTIEENVAVQRLMANPKFQGFVGENSAMQYFTPEAGIDPDEVARGFVKLWLDSPEHRNHIQAPVFDRTGIGVAANGNEIYAAQVFASDLGLPPRE